MELTTVVVRTHHLIFFFTIAEAICRADRKLTVEYLKEGEYVCRKRYCYIPSSLNPNHNDNNNLLTYHFLLTQEKKPARAWQPPKPCEEPAPSQPIPAKRNNISTPTTTTHTSPVKQQQAPTQSKTWMYQPPTVTKSQPAPLAKSPVQERKEEVNVLPAAARAHLR